MILTCPECATRFVVGDADLPPSGRRVRCSSCAHVWLALPEGRAEPPAPDFDLVFEQTPGDPLKADVFTDRQDPHAPFESDEDDAPLSRKIRAQQQQKRATRQAMAAGVIWALLCASYAAVLVGAILFKVQIVRAFPSTSGAFAAVNLPVNPTGLSLESVQGGPGLYNGRAALIISGLERNIEVDARPPSPVKVSLFDKAGKKIAEKSNPVEGGPLAPGETRPFTVNLLDPPVNVAEFQVELQFTRETARPAARAAAHEAPLAKGEQAAPPKGAPELRGEAAPQPEAVHRAVAAEPLPSSSPYALPGSASEAAVGKPADARAK